MRDFRFFYPKYNFSFAVDANRKTIIFALNQYTLCSKLEILSDINLAIPKKM